MKKLLYKEVMDWKGKSHKLELFEVDGREDMKDLGTITQCQAVAFIDPEKIVLYKHKDGYYGLPGGTIEEGESYERALRRELLEESACEVLDYGLLGYVKDTEINGEKIKYQLRFWVRAKLLDQPVQDPDGKALSRKVTEISKANRILGWGKRGEALLDLAQRKYKGK
jgi:ADP-ribose pyrophosphatase YjhB (NUDIX family)